jgi:hypothetical protein
MDPATASRASAVYGKVESLHSRRHGAYSERQIRPRASRQKRRILRQIGLRAGDLDSVGRAYLDQWARAQAKVELLDEWFAEHGFLDDKGEPVGGAKVYFVALNAARLNLARFEEHLRSGRAERGDALAALLEQGRRVRAEVD